MHIRHVTHEIDGDFIFVGSAPKIGKGDNLTVFFEDGNIEALHVIIVEVAKRKAFFAARFMVQPCIRDFAQTWHEWWHVFHVDDFKSQPVLVNLTIRITEWLPAWTFQRKVCKVYARNFAQLGKRVLLIEADLRNPSLHRSIGVRAEMGLSSLLSGAASIQQVIMDTDDERLNVVLAGPLPPNPAELLAGSRLLSMLSVAAEKYDQVIIDGPPVLGIADAPILSSLVSGTLLVTKSGKTRIKTAQIALKRLSAARARIIGGLLTHYNANAAGYGYDYESYYSYGTTPKLGKD